MAGVQYVEAAIREADAKAIHGKIREKVAAFSKSIEEQLGAEKVKALAEDVRKSGDVVKALGAKVQAAVEKALAEESAKAGDAPECDGGACDKEKKPGACPVGSGGAQ